MTSTAILEPGNYYHVYNRGVRKHDIFVEKADYLLFLHLYERYIRSVAETYAWVLMPNHFHLLVKIKEYDPRHYPGDSGDKVRSLVKVHTASQHFSNLFNTYAQYINRRNQTKGCVFERPFKRKFIDTEEYLSVIVSYIHNNPVHHGFCGHAGEYPWSSYMFYEKHSLRLMRYQKALAIGSINRKHRKMFKKPEDIEKIDKWLRL
jgi:REP element-mobilizing transposase RayT